MNVIQNTNVQSTAASTGHQPAGVHTQQGSRPTLVRGVWEKREKPSNRYSWSSYSITVGLSVWNTNEEGNTL